MKWKWLITLVLIFVILFSIVRPVAATELNDPDVQPTATSETELEMKEDNSPENMNMEPSVDSENIDSMLSSNFIPGVHEPNWSMDSQFARAAEGAVPTYQEAYQAMIALKERYYEGMTWTNFTPYGSNGSLGDSYTWKGGTIYGANRGVGCAAFAFILSDAAFGSLPARAIEGGSFTFEDVKVGDILRVNGNTHSVIVLQKSAGGVVIAEANYNKSVHWGRVMSVAEVLSANYIITRYPKDYVPVDDPEADKVAQEGTAGSLNWSLTNAGVLTIFGNGVIPDYSLSNLPPWNGCNAGTIIIEKGVTGIGDYAFYQSKALNIYIPDGIVKIGQSAFEESALISVTIPGTVGNIGNKAFCNCGNLTSVTVSEGVKAIGNEAFRACTSLIYIDFPASITSVGAGAFMDCAEMIRVRFKPGNERVILGDDMFVQCWKLTSVTLPQTADCISARMFQSCSSLSSLYIPASVKEIGENPFTSCNSLAYIYFGGSEAEWKGITNPYLEGSLKSTGTTVIFNAAFDDPFAADPNDPGDFLPDEDEDKKNPDEPDDDKSNPDDSKNNHEHNWSESWNCNETYHWHECDAGCFITDNNDKDGYGEHSYGGWVIDISATGSVNGSRHRDCTVCHYRQTDSIPASDSSDGSNDNSGSSGEAGGINGNGGGGNWNWQHEYIQKNNKTANFADRFINSEKFPGSESEFADIESLLPQDQKEPEMASDELTKSDKKEIQQAADEEVRVDNNRRSDKADTGIIVSVLIVLVAVVPVVVFVLIRKKNSRKKSFENN